MHEGEPRPGGTCCMFSPQARRPSAMPPPRSAALPVPRGQRDESVFEGQTKHLPRGLVSYKQVRLAHKAEPGSS